MSSEDALLQPNGAGQPPPFAPGQSSSMKAAGGHGDGGGDMAGGGWREEAEDGDEWEDDLDSYQLEKRMNDRRRAKSLPASFFEEDIPANGEGRKRVKFADSIGLNLASVKHFNTLEDPQVPTKVLSRLNSYPQHQQDLLGVGELFQSALTMDRLVRCFPQPAESSGFETRVRDQRVCLEKITITQFDVRGQIRVGATFPNQEVGVRYTFNDWLSHVDAQAQALAADPQRPALVGERFTFTMYTPPFLDPSSSVSFAVYLQCDEGVFWDNNEGKNYTLKHHCFPSCAAPYVSAAFHAT
ncbi:unnamed protein product [Arctogadus glacialis]